MPYPEFPLAPHASGHWCKRINGTIRYFGRWGKRIDGKLGRVEGDGWKAALELYTGQRDDLVVGCVRAWLWPAEPKDEAAPEAKRRPAPKRNQHRSGRRLLSKKVVAHAAGGRIDVFASCEHNAPCTSLPVLRSRSFRCGMPPQGRGSMHGGTSRVGPDGKDSLMSSRFILPRTRWIVAWCLTFLATDSA
jgi:hypothetical protein